MNKTEKKNTKYIYIWKSVVIVIVTVCWIHWSYYESVDGILNNKALLKALVNSCQWENIERVFWGMRWICPEYSSAMMSFQLTLLFVMLFHWSRHWIHTTRSLFNTFVIFDNIFLKSNVFQYFFKSNDWIEFEFF